jgi:hypothetical protein
MIERGEELVLRASRFRYALYALGCLVFVAIGALLAERGRPEGWWLALVFGASALLFLIGVAAGENYLRLTTSGFEVRTFFRSHFYRWQDVLGFGVARLHVYRYVTIFLMPDYIETLRGREAAAAMTGVEGMLPDTYGMRAEDLVELLEEWRVRHRLPSVNPPSARPTRGGPRLPN